MAVKKTQCPNCAGAGIIPIERGGGDCGICDGTGRATADDWDSELSPGDNVLKMACAWVKKLPDEALWALATSANPAIGDPLMNIVAVEATARLTGRSR